MSDHATHCKDPHCYGCSCTPDCDYWDEEPNVLAERNRIIALLEATEELRTIEAGWLVNYADTAIALIKGETEHLSS